MPFFPEMHIQSLRKKPRSAAQQLADETLRKSGKSLLGLKACLGRFIPEDILKNNEKGHHSRHRIFSKETVFWAFFSQIIDADGGCAEVVKKMKAHLSFNGGQPVSVSTGSYCKSRTKLVEQDLIKILAHTTESFHVDPDDQPLARRRVVVVDGTGLSMPDTPENQANWPQISSQKTGCGFPTMRLLGCFELATGAILSYAIGNKKNHELPLLRQQEDTFEKGDIFLGDKGFCSFFDLNRLLKKGVDSVVTLARRIPKTEQTCIKKMAKNDLLIHWKRPAMIRKELIMHFIAYNTIRHLIYETAHAHEQDPMRLSYKGALQALRQAEAHFNRAALFPQEIRRIREIMIDSIRTHIIPFRPGRSEPRCLKRRPKSYQLLTESRHEMNEIKHRSKYRAKVA